MCRLKVTKPTVGPLTNNEKLTLKALTVPREILWGYGHIHWFGDVNTPVK